MTEKLDYLLFIGRFQPFHNGHYYIISRALERAKKVIVLCGSSNRPRSLRHPWHYAEREAMIRSCFLAEQNKKIITAPLFDATYNDSLWITRVHHLIAELIGGEGSDVDQHQAPSVGIIGHLKDDTSYYLRLFPHWQLITEENYQGINSTDLREAYFYHQTDVAALSGKIPVSIMDYLNRFRHSNEYKYIHQEFNCVRLFQERWSQTPYPPVFVTVNAVVVCSGNILIIKRQRSPGQGLQALPGGFIETNEYLLDACLRKLREETGLQMTETDLKASLKYREVFDQPSRAERGRTIAHVFYFSLPASVNIKDWPVQNTMVDAAWIPLSELDTMNMFEDHFFIIQKMVGI